MSTPLLVLTGATVGLVLATTASWIRMFQIKEYRFDRLQSQLMESGSAYLRHHWLKRPAASIRNALIFVLALGTSAFFFYWLNNSLMHVQTIVVWYFMLAIAYPVAAVAVMLAVGLTEPLAQAKRANTIKQAQKKLADLPVQATIISGSYGKSSVKECLSSLASTQFQTGKTLRNMNTDVGLALSVLQSVTAQTQHFIAEVGGYKRGEVHQAVAVFDGHVATAIITAFGNQHVALYGNRDNLIRTESEVVPFLPEHALCYIGLSAYQEEIFQQEIVPHARCRFITYSLDAEKKADIYAQGVHTTASGTTATITYGKRRIKVDCAVLGKHAIENVLPVVGWAIDHGIDVQTIEHAMTQLRPVLHKLSIHRGVGESVVIDDSGNSSYQGFLAAIDVMQLFPQKNKVIIGAGIIELGSEKEQTYRAIVSRLNDVSISYITTDSSFNKYSTGSAIRIVKTEKEIRHILDTYAGNETLILLEGRQPKNRIKSIIMGD